MELIVKSRRARSSISETPNSTTACLPSVLISLRKVVTSCGLFCVSSTATVPCSMPTGTVRLKSFWTSGGGAAVVRSKSLWGLASSASRIAPPTHHVSYPASSSFLAMFNTSRGISRRGGKLPTEHRAPVHIQDLSRDVAGERRTKKNDGTRDVVGAGHPAEGDPFPDGGIASPRRLRHLPVHPPRRPPVHGQARRPLDGES